MKDKQKSNCPNCGAPVDNDLGKCPYCGTNYFNIIDIGEEPMTVRFNFGGSQITARGLIKATTLTMEPGGPPMMDMEMFILCVKEFRRKK